jgi:hypothetical protein
MPLYLCRWENGDFSVVQAKNKMHALEMLDETANAEGLPLYPINDFMAHFRLTDEGLVELEEFGEQFGDHIRENVYPVLSALNISLYDHSPEDKPRIKAAVQQERDWLKANPAPEPDTELGKRIKAQMDMPTAVVNRQIRSTARQVLREARPKGKPN